MYGVPCTCKCMHLCSSLKLTLWVIGYSLLYNWRQGLSIELKACDAPRASLAPGISYVHLPCAGNIDGLRYPSGIYVGSGDLNSSPPHLYCNHIKYSPQPKLECSSTYHSASITIARVFPFNMREVAKQRAVQCPCASPRITDRLWYWGPVQEFESQWWEEPV